MSLEQAATFLTASILTMLGFIIVFAGIIVINNMLAKHWKPVRLFRFLEYPSPRFIDEHKDSK
jgi:hypothetical protein